MLVVCISQPRAIYSLLVPRTPLPPDAQKQQAQPVPEKCNITVGLYIQSPHLKKSIDEAWQLYTRSAPNLVLGTMKALKGRASSRPLSSYRKQQKPYWVNMKEEHEERAKS